MNCLIGLDIGASAVKGVVLSVDGKILDTKPRNLPILARTKTSAL